MAEISVSDGRVTRIYQGDPEPVRSASSGELRWSEFELYRLDDGGWLVHRNGRSVVYHRAGTSETTVTGSPPGRLGTVDDLPDDAEPCSSCRPPLPRDLGEDEDIRVETDRHKLDVLRTPEQVVGTLVRNRGRDGSESFMVPAPVADLLDQAVRRWPEFRVPATRAG